MNNFHSYIRYPCFQLKFKIFVLMILAKSNIDIKFVVRDIVILFTGLIKLHEFIYPNGIFFFLFFLQYHVPNPDILTFQWWTVYFVSLFQNRLYWASRFKYFRYLQVYKRELNHCLYYIINFLIVCSDLLQK